MQTHYDKAMDARARRAAHAAGYVARKSRFRPDSHENHGGFTVFDPSTNIPMAGFNYSMSAEEVVEWAKSD